MSSQKSNNLIFGIIGYGSIGKVHKKVLDELGYKNYIYDTKKKNKNTVTLTRLKKLCNTIIISSPSYSHFYYLKFFSKTNKHIFIEKPFSHEFKKTNKIIQIYKKNKKIIAINYNLRVRESIISLKNILKKVKKIYWSNFLMSSDVLKWRNKYEFSKNYTHHKLAGGIIFDSIHEIDLNNFLFKKIKFVNSNNLILNKKIFKKYSFSNINLLAEDKFLSTIQLDYNGNPDQREINILTDIGLIKVDIKKNKMSVYNKKNKRVIFRKFNENKFKDYKKMLENFIKCIKNPKHKIICGPEDAIKNLKLAIKANV